MSAVKTAFISPLSIIKETLIMHASPLIFHMSTADTLLDKERQI